MNWQHLLSMAEDPLLVRVGGEVVGGGVVARHVVEQILVLRGRVLGAVRSRETKDCHEGSRSVLHVLDKPQSPVGDQVREVIAGMGAVENIAILPPVLPTCGNHPCGAPYGRCC